MTREHIADEYFQWEYLLTAGFIFILAFVTFIQILKWYTSVLIALGMVVFLTPFIKYLQGVAQSEENYVYYGDYEKDKAEFEEYMRIERIKMQDGRCANCNGYLDPNLPYCPNCNFKIEDYA